MIRTLEERDLDALINLRAVGFFHQIDSADSKARDYIRSRLPFTTGYFVDADLASVITLYPFEMYWAGRPVAMAGLAGVMSAPEYRRQGHVRMLLSDAFEKLYEKGIAWSLEYPFDPAYYARFGYQSVSNGVWLELPCQALFQGKPPRAERLSKNELDKLKPIYQAFAKDYNFTLRRDSGVRDTWSNLLKSPWESRERSLYLLEDSYCIFDFSYRTKNGEKNILRVHDFAYSSAQGRDNLLRFLGSFEGQADEVTMHLASDDPLVFDYAHHSTAADTILQAKLINVQAALEGSSSPYEISFKFHLIDKICSWNNQTFALTFEGNQVSVEASSGSPDLSMKVSDLVLLLSGSVSARSLESLGRVEGDSNALRALASLAQERIPFMPRADFF